MNSLKTTIVCVVLLGVLYGMYQVINTPVSSLDDEETMVTAEEGTLVDPSAILDDNRWDRPPASMGDESDDFSQYGVPSEDDESVAPDRFMGGTDPSLDQLRIPGADEGNDTDTSSMVTDNDLNPAPGIHQQTSQSEEYPNRLAGADEVDQYPADIGTPEIGASTPITGADEIATQETRRLSETWSQAEQLIERQQYTQALGLLSKFYDDSSLTEQERVNLQTWLDALAAKVIYSVEHHVETAHTVQPNETLNSIANRYQIPASLLYNINSSLIGPTGQVTPGTQLKVVPGPFEAKVDLKHSRMTLFVNSMYAGSFPIWVGQDPVPMAGDFAITSKSSQGRNFISATGSDVPPSSPSNPYGQYVLDLGQGIVIHAKSRGASTFDGRGCIALSADDAKDVYDILSERSVVRIIR